MRTLDNGPSGVRPPMRRQCIRRCVTHPWGGAPVHLTVGAIAVIGVAVVLLLHTLGYLRVWVSSGEDTYIATASGHRVKIVSAWNLGAVFDVTFECAELDDELVSRIAAELVPIFSRQAEQCGLSLLRLDARAPLPGGW